MANSIQHIKSKGILGLSISVEGPRVGKARVSVDDFAEIMRRTQQALKRIGQVLYGESSIGKGRKKREIEDLCEIFLVSWKPGSAVAEVELAEPPAQLGLFGYIGEESLKAFLKGMEAIQTEPTPSLPVGYDGGVLQTCDSLGRVLERGIDSIKFEPRNGVALPSIAFDRKLRERIRGLLGKPIGQRQAEKIGRLEELNGHGGLTGRLWEADGTKWLCIFKPDHLELLPDIWLRTVKLVGETVIEPGGERTLSVESILPLDGEIEETGVAEETFPFWSSPSLEELAEQQRVSPAEDLDAISALWPVDDDPDKLMDHILSDRSARRRISGGGVS
jgi:hypothetical protein